MLGGLKCPVLLPRAVTVPQFRNETLSVLAGPRLYWTTFFRCPGAWISDSHRGQGTLACPITGLDRRIFKMNELDCITGSCQVSWPSWIAAIVPALHPQTVISGRSPRPFFSVGQSTWWRPRRAKACKKEGVGGCKTAADGKLSASLTVT